MKKFYNSPEAEIEKFNDVCIFTTTSDFKPGGNGEGDEETGLLDF